jgi:hypothetical protein
MRDQANNWTRRPGWPRLCAVAAALFAAGTASVPAQGESAARLPDYLRDRGSGIPTSRPGTYVTTGEWLVEPYLFYAKNKDFEYDPSDLGFPSPQESLHGRYEATEGRVFAAYGLSERVAVELDVGGIDASLQRDPLDVSGLPPRLSNSGLGQLRARVNWRWMAESERRPELFSYAEIVIPHDSDQPLAGTPDLVLNGGLGVIRGFRWGTLSMRIGLEYDTGSESAADFHEYAFEYLRRFTDRLSLYLGYVVFEGDEAYLATELHWAPRPNIMIRLGNRLGIEAQPLSATGNSADYVPTLGVLIRFPGR